MQINNQPNAGHYVEHNSVITRNQCGDYRLTTAEPNKSPSIIFEIVRVCVCFWTKPTNIICFINLKKILFLSLCGYVRAGQHYLSPVVWNVQLPVERCASYFLMLMDMNPYSRPIFVRVFFVPIVHNLSHMFDGSFLHARVNSSEDHTHLLVRCFFDGFCVGWTFSVCSA